MDIEQLKFPVGKYHPIKNPDPEILANWKRDIESFPSALKSLLTTVSTETLNWKYRPGGWTIKQVVHHCADSHMNSIIRFKLALTEDRPTIRPYIEHKWAELPDSKNDDISISMALIEALHAKWIQVLNELSEADLQRIYVHPEHGEEFNLAETIGSYAWHCRHHLAHVRQALASKGKYN